MTTIAAQAPFSARFLQKGAKSWFISMLIGHWVFLTYVVVIFGVSAALGDMEYWNARISHAHIEGDDIGNLSVMAHLGFAAIVLGLGPLQLLPSIRANAPWLHRWMGRLYVSAVLIATFSGMYMLFVRDIGSWSLKTGFVLQGAVLSIFAFYALRHAIARNIDRHYRWAMRFFMVASIALTFRVILMAWALSTGGMGINMETGEGWFLDLMIGLQFLPLLMFEAYSAAKDGNSATGRVIMGALLFVSTLIMYGGVALMSYVSWFKAFPF